jgi:hypothetical protein
MGGMNGHPPGFLNSVHSPAVLPVPARLTAFENHRSTK